MTAEERWRQGWRQWPCMARATRETSQAKGAGAEWRQRRLANYKAPPVVMLLESGRGWRGVAAAPTATPPATVMYRPDAGQMSD